MTTPRMAIFRSRQIRLIRCVGVSSLKEIWLSIGTPGNFSPDLPGRSRTFPAEALELRFLWFEDRQFALVQWATILEILGPIAHGLLNEFGRRRSFHGDCTSSHPFVVPLPFGKRSGRLGTGDLARNYSFRPSCETKLVPIRPTSSWDRSRRIHDTPRTEQGPQGSWLAPRSMQSRRKFPF
jgi:hypothetical protein